MTSPLLNPVRQALRVLTGAERSSAVVAVRVTLCSAALVAVAAAAGETRSTAYTALNYPILIYAGLFTPWPAALALLGVAAFGPNPHGSVLVTTLENDSAAVVRPLALTFVVSSALALARSHRQSEHALRESEQRLFSFLERMPVAVSVLDANGAFYYANSLARRLTGQETDPPMAVALAEALQVYMAGSDTPYPEGRMPIMRALHGETSMVDDMVLRRPDGDINLQVWGAPVRDESGRVQYAVAAFSNITAQKRFERALIESEARFRAVFEDGPWGMAIVGPDNRFLEVNQALCGLTGYRGDELGEMTFLDIIHPDDRGLEPVGFMERGEGELVDAEKRYLRKDGATIWVRASIRTVRDANGEAAYKLKMVQDITEQRRAQEMIEHMAYADPLTDLPNRRLLYDRLTQAVARGRRHGGGVSLLSIDLDGFKGVNDRYGHAAGDALLVETAHRLRACLRDSDTVARMGGDEFLVLLTDADATIAEAVRGRISASLGKAVTFGSSIITSTPSIGLATLGPDGLDADTLVATADSRMYQEKARHAPARAS